MNEATDVPAQRTEVAASADLRCPLCDYDVHGLPEPRCPECGHVFEWEELTDPARQRVRWLFEHQGTMASYLKTQWRLANPWRFWRTMRPAYTQRVGRLVWFFACGMLLVLLAMAPLPSVALQWTKLIGIPSAIAWEMVIRAGIIPLFAIATAAAFLLVLGIMQESFGKVRIKPAHGIRVALYAADPVALAIAMIFAALATLAEPLLAGTRAALDPYAIGLGLASAFYILLSAFRLEAGVRRYLGMPRGWLVAMLSVIIAYLLCAVVAMLINELMDWLK